MIGFMAVLRALRQRWSGQDGQDLARSAVVRLLVGDSLDDLPLGLYRGRVDLRGLWLASARGLPGPRLAGDLEGVPAADGGMWTDLDLSHATFRLDLAAATVTNVLFDRVAWQGWRVRDSQLADCSFRAADLRDSNFDVGNAPLPDQQKQQPASRYQRCDFTRTRTGPYVSWGRAVFEECVFDSTKFGSPNWFYGAELKKCRFRGEFRDVSFGWPNPGSEPAPVLDSVDAREATFGSLGIYAHRGSGLILPKTATPG
jgi:hypothetical protein